MSLCRRRQSCVTRLGLGISILALSACSVVPLHAPTASAPSNVNADAVLTPTTRITRDLVRLPPPKFKVPVAVYAFRDQTGQFKPQPDSNLSNSVTQGAASILIKSLLDSGWFLPIEREGLQNLLTERRVARALETPADKGKPGSSYPSLMAANFILEGGIIGYESNVRTGGEGASLLGIGAETKYRVDQVTINLRSVDVRTGQVVNSVSVTKTIFSHEISANVYRFISYKTLLQAEGGYSTNEPSQLAVKEAIELAVIQLTVQGMRDRAWALRDESDWKSPLVQSYLREAANNLAEDMRRPNEESDQVLSMQAPTMLIPPSLPLPIGPTTAQLSSAQAVGNPPVTPSPSPSPAVTAMPKSAMPAAPVAATVAPPSLVAGTVAPKPPEALPAQAQAQAQAQVQVQVQVQVQARNLRAVPAVTVPPAPVVDVAVSGSKKVAAWPVAPLAPEVLAIDPKVSKPRLSHIQPTPSIDLVTEPNVKAAPVTAPHASTLPEPTDDKAEATQASAN
jgi:curli production assembly/transport component CsgG